MPERTLVVIGGGLVGLGVAYRASASKRFDRIVVLEKENQAGRHQSTHNSGVLHCGLYYQPGSLKAKLAVEGLAMMTDFCAEFDIDHEICGKIVLAVDEEEVPRLKDLQERGKRNGLIGLEWLEEAAIREREPHARGVAALLVPQEGIVDYRAVVDRLVYEIESAGHEVVTGVEVTDLVDEGNQVRVVAGDRSWRSDFVVACAGLQSDRIAEMGSEGRGEAQIVPFRGEYFELSKAGESLVNHLIYPVPDPRLPFLGVHYTRMIGGGVEAGPNAVLALKREGYRKTDFSLRDLGETLAYPGFLRFIKKYPKAVLSEFSNSFSKRVFLKNLQRMVPDIREEHLGEVGASGVRAQAISRQGDLLMDFAFRRGPKQLHVINAPSPGATACLAIGQYIVDQISEE
ncbi:MAG: L-2-hydroxyglutarate oxidase [Verrucomicrobiota bacterium]